MKAVQKLVALASCLVMCLSVGSVSAVEIQSDQCVQSDVIPCAMYIKDKSCTMRVSEKSVYAEASVHGQRDVGTRAEVSMKIQRKSGTSWITVDTWSNSQSGLEAFISGSCTATKGTTYRAVATVTVWSGKQSETMTITTAEKTA